MDTEIGSYVGDAEREPFKEIISIRFDQNLTYLRERTDRKRTEYERRIQKDEE
jgi:hypothetical protein